MNKSESISELVTALAAAQLKFDPVLKDSTNPHYKSRYADMASVIKATQSHLADNGLVVMQMLISEPEHQLAGVETLLAHKSGQFISERYMLPALMQGNRFDAQSCGSAFTYARRYAWQSIVGVAGEDDDAEAAVGSGSVQAAQAVATSKLRSKDGSEILIISPYMQGFAALSGSGLALVRANMDDSMRSKFGWVQKGNVIMVPVEVVHRLKEFCTFHDISVLDETPTSAGKPEPKPNGQAPAPPKATVEDMVKTFGGTPTPFSDDPATDPIILEAKHIRKPGKKEFLAVKWDGHEMSCFDTKLFPAILDHVKKPAMFDWSSKGQYKNLLHIVRLGGKQFVPQPVQAQITDGDVPF